MHLLWMYICWLSIYFSGKEVQMGWLCPNAKNLDPVKWLGLVKIPVMFLLFWFVSGTASPFFFHDSLSLGSSWVVFLQGILYVFSFGSGHNLVTLSYRLVAGRRLSDPPLIPFLSCPFHPCEVAAGRAISSTVYNYFVPNFLPGVVTRTDQSIKSNWKP
jgi:hypothetical protein